MAASPKGTWRSGVTLHPLSPALPSMPLSPALPSVPLSLVLPYVRCPQCCSPSASPPGPSPSPPSFSCSARAHHMSLPFSRGSAAPRGIPAYSGWGTHPGEMPAQGRKGLRPSHCRPERMEQPTVTLIVRQDEMFFSLELFGPFVNESVTYQQGPFPLILWLQFSTHQHPHS